MRAKEALCYNRSMYLSDKFPLIAAEWDDNSPQNTNSSPETIKAGSGIKRGWICLKCGTKWLATPHARTGINKTGCPGECKKEKFRKTRLNTRISQNRLLSYVSPEIASEWDYTSKNNQGKNPKSVLAGDPKKYDWVCSEGHTWSASVGARVNQNTNCPVCSHRKLLSGFNDFSTLYPELSKQLHPTKNTYEIKDVLGAPKKKTWWQCVKGHEWETTFDVRARGRDCPKCSLNQTSKIEKQFRDAFSHELQQINIDHTFVLTTTKGKKLKPDIYGKYKNLLVVIEYDGNWWHKDSNKRDLEKTLDLLKEGIAVIRIREKPLPFLELKHSNFAQFRFKYGKDIVSELVKTIIIKLNEWKKI